MRDSTTYQFSTTKKVFRFSFSIEKEKRVVGVFVEGTVMLLCSTHLLFVTMAGFWMFLIACQYQKFAGTDARKRSN